MTNDPDASLTREALYDAVWRTPMRTLARRYGCSDRGLAKACDRYRIPVPPRGYWAKLAVGQRVPRPKLPKLTASELQELGNVELPIPPSRRAEARTMAVAVETAMPEHRVKVRETLRSAHALVIRTRELLEKAVPDDRGILKPDGHGYHTKTGALAIHVSKAETHRALRIFDALLWEVEVRGWTVTCPAKVENRGTGVALLGEELAISIEEKVKRFDKPKDEHRVTKGHSYDVGHGPYTTTLVDPYPRWGYTPLGQLSLRVLGYGSPLFQVADRNTQRLEDRIDEFLAGVVRLAEQQVERRRHWAEQERIRLEAAELARDRERQRAAEAARVASLEQDAVAWRKAADIRAYIAAARAQELDPTAERQAYFEWALAQAERMDPLTREPNR